MDVKAFQDATKLKVVALSKKRSNVQHHNEDQSHLRSLSLG